MRLPAFDAPRAADLGGFLAVGADPLGERGEQSGQQRVARRVETEPGRAGRERVDVGGPADGAAVHRLDVDEAGLAQAVEVQADGVGVQAERVGELVRGAAARRAGELAIHREARLVAERLEHRQQVHFLDGTSRIGHIFKVYTGFIRHDYDPARTRHDRAR